ncbi:MAG TPA: hypothetical protein PLC42_02545 [Parachlamydiaceae bacterium]|nr:hypothetical protein [Parachlamydiaceae bacterium]
MVNLELLPQDCWNHIVSSRTDFSDLKNLRSVSQSILEKIESCCKNILNKLNLNDEDIPALKENHTVTCSFRRILALEDIIKKWVKKQPVSLGDPNTILNLLWGFDFSFGNYKKFKKPKKSTFASAQTFVFTKFQNLRDSSHSLQNFCTTINHSSDPCKRAATTIYYFTSSIFKEHPGNQDLKKLVLKHSNYMPLAIEESATKTIEKLLNDLYKDLIFSFPLPATIGDYLEIALKRFKIKSFEQIITHIKEKNQPVKEFEPASKPIQQSNSLCSKYYRNLFTAYETIQKANKPTLELFIDLLGDLQVSLPPHFIHRVVKADAIPLLVYLKQTGERFNLPDENISTPLHLIKSVEAAKILIEGGAIIDEKNNFNQTPLTTALLKAVLLIPNILLTHMGFKSWLQISNSNNLLNKQIEIAKFLIDSGAKIKPQDEELMANIPDLLHLIPKKVKAKPNYTELFLSKLSLIVKAALVDSTFSKFFLQLSSFFERPLGKSIEWYSLTIAKGIHSAALKYFN